MGQQRIHPVVLCGGSGTRLWPLSRALYPKQLLALASERTLLQDTILRATDADRFAPPLVVGNEEHRYIQSGNALDGLPGCHAVTRFVEKPDAAMAAALVASGEYLWNSGIFLFPAARYLAELERHEPAIVAASRRALDGAEHDLSFLRLDAEAFAASPATSIDYAVMERVADAVVVPVDMGWSDVGSHRLENPGRIPLHLVEVQTGTYLEEDDIVRLDDAYGR